MATIALPSSPGFQSIRAIRRSSTFLGMSPTNFTQQVYGYKGKLKVVELRLPPMEDTEATAWENFLDDLEGHVNTFNLDLSDVYPGESGLGSVAMRLVDPDVTWNLEAPLRYGFSFLAMEAK